MDAETIRNQAIAKSIAQGNAVRLTKSGQEPFVKYCNSSASRNEFILRAQTAGYVVEILKA